MKLRVAITLLCLVRLSLAAEFWQDKPWEKWNDDEVNRILRNSPWARDVSVPDGQGKASATGTSYTLQLQSAGTLRRAMARRLQIDYGYDDGKQSDALDAQLRTFLSKQFPDIVVVGVTFHSKSDEVLGDSSMYWSAQTVGKLKATTHLEINGRAYPLTAFQVTAPREFVLAFAKPKTVSPNGVAVVEFAVPRGPGGSVKRVRAEFKLNEMVVNGQLEL